MADVAGAAIAAIRRTDAVPMILDVICRTTGMGFAAVARVTDDQWHGVFSYGKRADHLYSLPRIVLPPISITDHTIEGRRPQLRTKHSSGQHRSRQGG
jgi:hypothetical protein